MDTLQCMKVFAQVAQRSGFAAASRDLRMSPAAVTKHVAALETRLGARLFDRTTRTVALTPVGRQYLERCLACLRACDEAEASVRRSASAPSGLLRVTAPYDFQDVLAPIVGRFVRAHPKVQLDLRYSNRTVDLVEEGFDVAVRVSFALKGDLVATALRPMDVTIAASPEYLASHGRPRAPQDLARHKFAMLVEPQLVDQILCERDGKQVFVKLQPALLSNGGPTLVAAAIAGACMVGAPAMLTAGAIAAGRLEPVLIDWAVFPGARLYAVHPHRRFVSPNVRAFIDMLREDLAVTRRAA